MPWYIDDHDRKTKHLTTLEQGAYRLLIDYAWQNKGIIPKQDSQIIRISGLTPSEWRRCKPNILPFFLAEMDGYIHPRVVEELEVMADMIEKKSSAGKIAAASRWHNGRIAGAVVPFMRPDSD